MGVVELPEGAIIELKLRIDRNPTNMRWKVLLEAKLVQKIDKNLHSSHRCGDFGDLHVVRVRDFYEIDNRGESDS